MWGTETWGEMAWLGGVPLVPLTSPIGMVVLVAAFVGGAMMVLRPKLPKYLTWLSIGMTPDRSLPYLPCVLCVSVPLWLSVDRPRHLLMNASVTPRTIVLKDSSTTCFRARSSGNCATV